MPTAYSDEVYGKDPMRPCIYGPAVGDALGVPCEFCVRDAFECTNMVGGCRRCHRRRVSRFRGNPAEVGRPAARQGRNRSMYMERRYKVIDGYLLNMRVSNDVSDGKGQALKPLEEAAEVFGAWQKCDDMRYATATIRKAFRGDLIDGCMDTVQAVADLLAAVGATQGEVDAATKRMDERNWDPTAMSPKKCGPKEVGHGRV